MTIKRGVYKKRILALGFVLFISAMGFQPIYADNAKIQQLIEDLKDEKSFTRSGAARALGEIGDKSAVPALIAALKDEKSSVQLRAAAALGEIGDKSVVPALTKTLKDKNLRVRVAAERAIKKIEESGKK